MCVCVCVYISVNIYINDLEVWPQYCGYNDKLVYQFILKVRKYRRLRLLYSQKEEGHKDKLALNITILLSCYYIIILLFFLIYEYFVENLSSFEAVPGHSCKNQNAMICLIMTSW